MRNKAQVKAKKPNEEVANILKLFVRSFESKIALANSIDILKKSLTTLWRLNMVSTAKFIYDYLFGQLVKI